MVSQVEALAKTVAALNLRPEHEALRAYCEGLATALDEFPQRATLWREYRPALELLLVAGEVAEDDGQAAFLRLVSAPVGDAKKAGKGDARPSGRRSGKAAGATADAVATTGRGRRSGAAS